VDPGLASLVIIACLVGEAFVSGAEITLFAANKLAILHSAEQGSRPAKLILEMLDEPVRLLGGSLVMHTLVVVTGASLATSVFVSWFDHRGAWAAFVVISIVVLIVGKIFPRAIGQHFADRLATVVMLPLQVMFIAFYPVLWVITWVLTQGLCLFGLELSKKYPIVANKELELLRHLSDRSSTLGVNERRMIRRIFGFSDTRVHEAMIPLVEVIALDDNATVDELMQAIQQHGFSRIAIFQDNIHNIVGWVNAFDVLSMPQDERSFRHLIRPAYYVPETRRIGDLLKDVQQKGIPLAVVVDEYGGTVGIVTIEDMLEEIVGEIEDEYDARERLYEVLPDGSFRIDARMEIDSINEILGLHLPTGNYATLAGFLLAQFERIPQRGELLMYEGLMLEVEKATNRTVEGVHIVPRLAPMIEDEKVGK
jgi:putative hemolysin